MIGVLNGRTEAQKGEVITTGDIAEEFNKLQLAGSSSPNLGFFFSSWDPAPPSGTV